VRNAEIEFGPEFVAQRAVDSDCPELLLNERRQYFPKQYERLGYPGPILAALRIISDPISHSLHSGDRLVDLLDIAAWKARLAPEWTGSIELFGVEHCLRARLGQYDRAAAEVDQLGTDNDRLLVHAEIAVTKAKQGRPDYEEHLYVMESIADQCDAEYRELAAMRISELSPELAVNIALTLPVLGEVIEYSSSNEPPNRFRGLWWVFARLADQSEEKAIELLENISNQWDRLFANLGIIHATISNNPSNMRIHIERLVNCIPEGSRSQAAGFITTFMAREYACMPVLKLLDMLDKALSTIYGTPGIPTELIHILDECIRQDPQACIKCIGSYQSVVLRDMLNWRLRAHGYHVPDHTSLAETHIGRELNLTIEINNETMSWKQVMEEVLAKATHPLTAVHATVCASRQVMNANDACNMLGNAFEFWNDDASTMSFYSRLEIVSELVKRNEGQLRQQVVKWYIDNIRNAGYGMVHHRANKDLGRVLASAFSEWNDDAQRFLSWLAVECRSVESGYSIFMSLFASLSESCCLELAQIAQNATQEITNSEPDEDSRTWLKDPCVLAALAQRIISYNNQLGVLLFLNSAREVECIKDEKAKHSLAKEIVKNIIHSEPRIAWQVCQMCGEGESLFTMAAESALREMPRPNDERRAGYLRLLLSHMNLQNDTHDNLPSSQEYKRMIVILRYANTYRPDMPNYESMPRNNIDPKILNVFRQYFKEVTAEYAGWYGHELYGAIAELALRNWSMFMNMVRDPSVSDYTVHMLKSEQLKKSILTNSESAETLLADVLAIRKAKERPTGRSEHPLQHTLCWTMVSAASYTPRLFMEILSRSPEWLVELFIKYIATQKLYNVWSDDQVIHALALLQKQLSSERVLCGQAMLAAWLSQQQRIEEGAITTIYHSAKECPCASILYESAILLKDWCPQIASEIILESILRAEQQNDEEILLHAKAEIVRALDDSNEEDDAPSLYRACLVNKWTTHEKDTDKIRMEIANIVSIIDQYESKDEQRVQRLLDSCVCLANITTETDVAKIIDSISQLDVRDNKIKRSYMHLILDKANQSGVIPTLAIAQSVKHAIGIVTVLEYIIQHDHNCDRSLMLSEIIRQLSQLEPSECANCLTSMAKEWNRNDPGYATDLYIEAMRSATHHSNASCYVSCLLDVAEICLEQPSMEYNRIADAICEHASQDIFSEDNMFREWKACSLMTIAICLWTRENPKAKEYLRRAADEYARLYHGSPFLGPDVLKVSYLIMYSRMGAKDANSMMDEILEVLDESARRKFVDEALKACVYGKKGNYPMSCYNVRQQGGIQECEPLIDKLLPLCSNGIAVEVHAKLSVEKWRVDDARSKSEIGKAIEIAAKVQEDEIGMECRESLWTVYAVTHGIEGCVRAILEVLADPDNKRLNLPAYIAVAAENVTDKEGFLRMLWDRLSRESLQDTYAN